MSVLFLLEETCERRDGAMMGCIERGFDWEGDREYGGVLEELLISVCARVCVCVCVCVRMMVDLEKCTKGLKDVLRGGLLLLDCWTVIEVHKETRAQRPHSYLPAHTQPPCH